MKTEVPAEIFFRIAESYSAQLAAEHEGPGPVRVNTAVFGGNLYTTFSVEFGGLGRAHTALAKAYQLLPESMHKGETTEDYRGWGERSDGPSLIVLAKKGRFVLGQRRDFRLGSPATKPLSLEEASSWDASQNTGWRTRLFQGAVKTWWCVDGHPVVRYEKGDQHHAALIWQHHGRIEELRVLDDVPLDQIPARPSSLGNQVPHPYQMALF